MSTKDTSPLGYWQPKWNKQGQEVTEYIDPSARVLSIYNTQ